MTATHARYRSDRSIVFLIGAIQFINILDFVMVMPLGPDFARALGFPESEVGLVAGSYTAAAAIAGLVGSLFLDRFDRRKALGAAMVLLVVATTLGGFAVDLTTLMLARILAGFGGGPATSISLSIIADTIPPERRGRALGAVAGAFSIASILGIPIALKLAEWGSWRMPFWFVGILGVVVLAAAWRVLPPMTAHLPGAPVPGAPVGLPSPRSPMATIRGLLVRPLVLKSYLMTGLAMAGGFMIIPNISAHLQLNLDFPRSHLDRVYFVGGIVSFATTRIAGRLNDRFGAWRTALAGCLLLATVMGVVFVAPPAGLPVVATFSFFFLAMGLRNVSHTTLASRVPNPDERAGFTSLQSTVQHLASATGSFVAAQMLHKSPDGRLQGIALVAIAAMILTLAMPFVMRSVEAAVRREESGRRGKLPVSAIS